MTDIHVTFCYVNLMYTDAAGLRFIINTPVHAYDERDRRISRSHASKAGKAQKRPRQIQSWIDPERDLAAAGNMHVTAERSNHVTVHSCIGSDFSGLRFPFELTSQMVQGLKHGVSREPQMSALLLDALTMLTGLSDRNE